MVDATALSILAREDIDGWEDLRRSTSGSIDLRYATLSDITLSNFNLSSCDFEGAYFDDCDLRRSDFSHAFLSNARFRKCMLSNASFYRASISDTEFDRCELDGTNFIGSYGLEIYAVESSYYDETTKFPSHIGDLDDWPDDEDNEDSDDASLEEQLEGPKVILGKEEAESGKSNLEPQIPKIPDRVIAPLETIWKNNKLHIERVESKGGLRSQIEIRVIRELRQELDALCEFLVDTNFDQRIVKDLQIS